MSYTIEINIQPPFVWKVTGTVEIPKLDGSAMFIFESNSAKEWIYNINQLVAHNKLATHYNLYGKEIKNIWVKVCPEMMGTIDPDRGHAEHLLQLSSIRFTYNSLIMHPVIVTDNPKFDYLNCAMTIKPVIPVQIIIEGAIVNNLDMRHYSFRMTNAEFPIFRTKINLMITEAKVGMFYDLPGLNKDIIVVQTSQMGIPFVADGIVYKYQLMIEKICIAGSNIIAVVHINLAKPTKELPDMHGLPGMPGMTVEYPLTSHYQVRNIPRRIIDYKGELRKQAPEIVLDYVGPLNDLDGETIDEIKWKDYIPSIPDESGEETPLSPEDQKFINTGQDQGIGLVAHRDILPYVDINVRGDVCGNVRRTTHIDANGYLRRDGYVDGHMESSSNDHSDIRVDSHADIREAIRGNVRGNVRGNTIENTSEDQTIPPQWETMINERVTSGNYSPSNDSSPTLGTWIGHVGGNGNAIVSGVRTVRDVQDIRNIHTEWEFAPDSNDTHLHNSPPHIASKGEKTPL